VPAVKPSPEPTPRRRSPSDLGTGRGHFVEVVGESHYQEALREIWQLNKPEREFYADLVAEPDNPEDPNAVAVKESGDTIGYLSREDAARYQQLVLQLTERGATAMCSARLAKREGTRAWGVWLDLAPPTILAKELGLKYTRVRKGKYTETDG
jgi:hypothetical protein